jgi:structural maintenance of chromosome 4
MEDDDDDETEKYNKTETTKDHKSFSVSRTLLATALVQYDAEEMKQKFKLFEQEKEIMAKNANMAAIAEYRKKEADYLIRYVPNY